MGGQWNTKHLNFAYFGQQRLRFMGPILQMCNMEEECFWSMWPDYKCTTVFFYP